LEKIFGSRFRRNHRVTCVWTIDPSRAHSGATSRRVSSKSQFRGRSRSRDRFFLIFFLFFGFFRKKMFVFHPFQKNGIYVIDNIFSHPRTKFHRSSSKTDGVIAIGRYTPLESRSEFGLVRFWRDFGLHNGESQE